MSYSNYSDRVKYEPPPRQRRTFPRWILIVIAILAVLGIGGYLALTAFYRSLIGRMKAGYPPPAVHIGSPLAWRALEHEPLSVPFDQGVMGGLFVADFDADGDEEILHIKYSRSSPLYEVDGSHTTCGIDGMEFMMGGATWDYERDGICEIVVETMLGDILNRPRFTASDAANINVSQVLPIFDLSKDIVTQLPVVGATQDSILIGDFDGDGFKDLMAPKPSQDSEYGSNSYVALGAYGQEIWEFRMPSGYFSKCVGDVDGDGRDELVSIAGKFSALRVNGMEQTEATISPGLQRIPQITCDDLDCDGIEEIFLGGQSYYNPATRQAVTLVWPTSISGSTMSDLSASVCTGDFISDADSEIAVCETVLGTNMLMFDQNGHCVYYEEFGDMVFQVAGVRADSKDYIVVRLMEKLLIYP